MKILKDLKKKNIFTLPPFDFCPLFKWEGEPAQYLYNDEGANLYFHFLFSSICTAAASKQTKSLLSERLKIFKPPSEENI